jgi:hypothetical protein
MGYVVYMGSKTKYHIFLNVDSKTFWRIGQGVLSKDVRMDRWNPKQVFNVGHIWELEYTIDFPTRLTPETPRSPLQKKGNESPVLPSPILKPQVTEVDEDTSEKESEDSSEESEESYTEDDASDSDPVDIERRAMKRMQRSKKRPFWLVDKVVKQFFKNMINKPRHMDMGIPGEEEEEDEDDETATPTSEGSSFSKTRKFLRDVSISQKFVWHVPSQKFHESWNAFLPLFYVHFDLKSQSKYDEEELEDFKYGNTSFDPSVFSKRGYPSLVGRLFDLISYCLKHCSKKKMKSSSLSSPEMNGYVAMTHLFNPVILQVFFEEILIHGCRYSSSSVKNIALALKALLMYFRRTVISQMDIKYVTENYADSEAAILYLSETFQKYALQAKNQVRPSEIERIAQGKALHPEEKTVCMIVFAKMLMEYINMSKEELDRYGNATFMKIQGILLGFITLNSNGVRRQVICNMQQNDLVQTETGSWGMRLRNEKVMRDASVLTHGLLPCDQIWVPFILWWIKEIIPRISRKGDLLGVHSETKCMWFNLRGNAISASQYSLTVKKAFQLINPDIFTTPVEFRRDQCSFILTRENFPDHTTEEYVNIRDYCLKYLNLSLDVARRYYQRSDRRDIISNANRMSNIGCTDELRSTIGGLQNEIVMGTQHQQPTIVLPKRAMRTMDYLEDSDWEVYYSNFYKEARSNATDQQSEEDATTTQVKRTIKNLEAAKLQKLVELSNTRRTMLEQIKTLEKMDNDLKESKIQLQVITSTFIQPTDQTHSGGVEILSEAKLIVSNVHSDEVEARSIQWELLKVGRKCKRIVKRKTQKRMNKRHGDDDTSAEEFINPTSSDEVDDEIEESSGDFWEDSCDVESDDQDNAKHGTCVEAITL